MPTPDGNRDLEVAQRRSAWVWERGTLPGQIVGVGSAGLSSLSTPLLASPSMQLPYEWQIGWRYTRAGSAGRRNGFISFISGVAMLGIALGVAAVAAGRQLPAFGG